MASAIGNTIVTPAASSSLDIVPASESLLQERPSEERDIVTHTDLTQSQSQSQSTGLSQALGMSSFHISDIPPSLSEDGLALIATAPASPSDIPPNAPSDSNEQDDAAPPPPPSSQPPLPPDGGRQLRKRKEPIFPAAPNALPSLKRVLSGSPPRPNDATPAAKKMRTPASQRSTSARPSSRAGSSQATASKSNDARATSVDPTASMTNPFGPDDAARQQRLDSHDEEEEE